MLRTWSVAAEGTALQFFLGEVPRVSNNALWLMLPQNWLLLFAGMAFLPAFWVTMSAWMRDDMRALRLAGWAMFLALSLVGNLYEPRIFGDLFVILYLPVAEAATNWLTRTSPVPAAVGAGSAALTASIERWGLAAIFGPWMLTVLYLVFVAQWPK
jgi:hypothetical protein